MSERVYVGIGSNIHPRRYVPRSLAMLRAQFGDLRVSSVYEGPPIGFEGPTFHNLVVGFETDLDAAALIKALRSIEEACDRRRDTVSADPSRTLDIDLLLYGTDPCTTNGVTLPHRDILAYAFVLAPLAEIAPEVEHPTAGRTFAELWQAFDGACTMHRLTDPSPA